MRKTKVSTVLMPTPIETVKPAAINPDSIAGVLFAKRMMELLMLLAPWICRGLLSYDLQRREQSL
jgi:hypothetical protein